jgi:hypothetical protein
MVRVILDGSGMEWMIGWKDVPGAMSFTAEAATYIPLGVISIREEQNSQVIEEDLSVRL